MLSAGFVIAPSIISCTSESKNGAASTNTSEATAGTAPNMAAIASIGLQLYSLRELLPADPKGVITKVAQAGYTDVETYGYSPGSGFWGLDPKALKAHLQENGLMSSSGHYGLDGYLGNTNEAELQTNIEAAVGLGQTYLTVPYLGGSLRKSADDYKAVAQRLNQAGEACKAAGLQLAYHNHAFEFDPQGDTTGYDIMLQETDPELVKFEADLYWVARAGKDVVAMFNQHPGRFALWHVKDMDKGNQDLNTEIGSGSIDYKKIFEQAATSGVNRIFVEQENFATGMDPFKSILQSYEYIKTSLMS